MTRSTILAAWLGLLAAVGGATAQVDFATIAPLGSGTPGSAGIPRLSLSGPPAVGQPGFGVRLSGGLPGAVAGLLVSEHLAPVYLPTYQARLYTGPGALRLPTVLDAEGFSPWLLGGPAQIPPSLSGLQQTLQGIVLDPAATGGVAFTHGLRLTFGAGSTASWFFERPQVTLPAPAFYLAVGDLNSDGQADMVAAHHDDSLSVVISGPGGTRVVLPPFPSGGLDVRATALADLDADGHMDLLVASHDNTIGLGRLSVFLGEGDGSFAPPKHRTVGNAAHSLAVADFTGDGLLDAALTRVHATVVFPGLGDGTLGAFVATFEPLLDGLEARSAAADLDLDGALDLVVWRSPHPSFLPDEVLVLKGTGTGGFVPAVPWKTGGEGKFTTFRLGDVDGDGLTDLVSLHDAQVTLRSGLGDGGFGPSSIVTLLESQEAHDLGLADLDADGSPEILASYVHWQGNTGRVAVLPALGGGLFGPPDVLLERNLVEFVPADANGDGATDLVGLTTWKLTPLGGLITVSHNRGDGTLDLPPAAIRGMTGARLGDLDDDGVLDLVETYPGPDFQVRIARGLGDGTFEAAADVPGFLHPFTRVEQVTDLDADGLPELIVVPGEGDGTSIGIEVRRALGGFTYATVQTLWVPDAQVVKVLVADLDGDDVADLLVLEALEGPPSVVTLFRGNGDASFTPAGTLTTSDGILDGAVGDLDGDGAMDLVLLYREGFGSRLVTHPGQGDGSFGPVLDNSAGFPVGQVGLADLNADGVLDAFLSGAQFSWGSWVASGVGDGTFAEPTQLKGLALEHRLVTADVNQDGALDLVSAWPAPRVRMGFGDGSFTEPRSFQTGLAVFGVEVGDLNGDGWPDLLCSADAPLFSGNGTAVLLNRGGQP